MLGHTLCFCKYLMDQQRFDELTKPLIQRYVFDQPILEPTIKACEHCLKIVKNPGVYSKPHSLENPQARHIKHHCRICKLIVFDGARVRDRHISPEKLCQLADNIIEE